MSVDVERNTQIAREFLETHGYVVLRQKSYIRAQERQRMAEVRYQDAKENAAAAYDWAQRELLPEILRLRDRCTYLYGAARAAGCTVDELAGYDGTTAAQLDGGDAHNQQEARD